jgi:LysM repeat protein
MPYYYKYTKPELKPTKTKVTFKSYKEKISPFTRFVLSKNFYLGCLTVSLVSSSFFIANVFSGIANAGNETETYNSNEFFKVYPANSSDINEDNRNIDYKKSDKPKTITTLDKKPTQSLSYLVKKGDTLSSIANSFNISLADLLKQNNLKEESSLKIGQVLTIQIQ